jgi:hypothetical protein
MLVASGENPMMARCLGALVVGWWACGVAAAQGAGDPYRTVEPVSLPRDKPGVYTLHFRYAPPRIISVDLPGVGKKNVWYMFFQVFNKTSTPQEFYPEFELVAKDLNKNFIDEAQPLAVQAIKRIEDPTGALDLKTSISISEKKIPVTKPDSVPRYVSGIAVWTDVPEQASQTNRFSVYVTGLSDGVISEEISGVGTVIKRKTLRLDFFKPTDNVNPRPGDVKPEDNGGLGGEKWDYRATKFPKPAEAAPPVKKDEGK